MNLTTVAMQRGFPEWFATYKTRRYTIAKENIIMCEKRRIPLKEIIEDYNILAYSTMGSSINYYCTELKGQTVTDIEQQYEFLLFQPINDGSKQKIGFFGEVQVHNFLLYCEFDNNHICIRAFLKELMNI